MTEQPPAKPWASRGFFWFGIGLTVWGIGLGIWHAYHWLRYGVGVDYPIVSLFADLGWGYPQVTWVGVQSMLDGIMAASAWIVLLLSGIFLVWWCGWFERDYEDRVRFYEQRQSDRLLREIEEERERHREEADPEEEPTL